MSKRGGYFFKFSWPSQKTSTSTMKFDEYKMSEVQFLTLQLKFKYALFYTPTFYHLGYTRGRRLKQDEWIFFLLKPAKKCHLFSQFLAQLKTTVLQSDVFIRFMFFVDSIFCLFFCLFVLFFSSMEQFRNQFVFQIMVFFVVSMDLLSFRFFL